ncbi:retinol dehydrogenase 11-like [Argonauta hians]
MIWYFILPVALVVLVIAYRVGSALWYHGKPLEYEGRGLRMDGKTVLITGGSSGIGKSATKFLLARGARVIMACRNMTKARNVADELLAITGVEPTMVTIVHLELSDLDSVRLCGRQILDTESKLDLLVNNAGMAWEGKLTTKQGFNHIFGTNYIGPFLLTHILTPLLKKSAPSRIINVSSTTHRRVKKVPNFSPGSPPGSGSGTVTPSAALTPTVRYPHLSTYAISKLANIWHANILAENLKKDGVTANSLCPGYVHTGIWFNGKFSVLNFFGWLASKLGRNPDTAALTLLYMAIDPSLDKVTGKFFENVSVSNMAPFAKDMTLAQKMWDVSMDMCGLSKKKE